MGSTLVDRDRGYQALMERLEKAAKAKLSVGIHADEGAKDHGGISVGDLATVHEFGTDTVPGRSFVRAFADEKEAESKAGLREAARDLITGDAKTLKEGLERMGERGVNEMRGRISDGIAPPLDDETVRRKGSSVPLVDTGRLVEAIAFKVED